MSALPSAALIAAVPLGQVARRAPAGAWWLCRPPTPIMPNPQAIEQGKQLYIQMNCAGCHAYNGKGNMGPDLTDSEWRYGGLPVQIYQSIFDGRPQGELPSWGAALPPAEIWKLVAYIQSLGGSVSVSDYEHARQGDQPGEQVAPEAQAERSRDRRRCHCWNRNPGSRSHELACRVGIERPDGVAVRPAGRTIDGVSAHFRARGRPITQLGWAWGSISLSVIVIIAVLLSRRHLPQAQYDPPPVRLLS